MFNYKICYRYLDNVIYYCREQKITINFNESIEIICAHKNESEITAIFIGNCVNHLVKHNTCFIYLFRSFLSALFTHSEVSALFTHSEVSTTDKFSALLILIIFVLLAL